MNILFVCSARNWGGNERWTALAMQVFKKNHNVHLCYRNAELDEAFGTDIPKTKAPFTHGGDLKTYAILLRLIRQHQIDVIISTKRKEYLICAIISRVFRVSHVVRLGIARPLPRLPWKRWVFEHGCNAILVNANAIKDKLVVTGFKKAERIHVIYNGVPRQPEFSSQPHNRFRIISTGALIARKGHDILIEAVSQLPEHLQKRLDVILLGEGRDRIRLQKKITDLNLQTNICIAGFQKNPQQWLAESTLFVQLSENEGMSNSVLEAMALGITVMTTNAGGMAELIQSGRNGLLVSRNAADVAQALKKWMASPDQLIKLGQAGRKSVESNFSLETMGHELEHLLNEVAVAKVV